MMKLINTFITTLLLIMYSTTALSHGSEATDLMMDRPINAQFSLQIASNKTDLLLATASRTIEQANMAAISYFDEHLEIYAQEKRCQLHNVKNTPTHSHGNRIEFQLIVICATPPTDSLRINYRLFADIDPGAQGVLRLKGLPARALTQGDNQIIW